MNEVLNQANAKLDEILGIIKGDYGSAEALEIGITNYLDETKRVAERAAQETTEAILNGDGISFRVFEDSLYGSYGKFFEVKKGETQSIYYCPESNGDFINIFGSSKNGNIIKINLVRHTRTNSKVRNIYGFEDTYFFELENGELHCLVVNSRIWSSADSIKGQAQPLRNFSKMWCVTNMTSGDSQKSFYAQDKSGALYTLGYGGNYRLLNRSTANHSTWTRVSSPWSGAIKKIAGVCYSYASIGILLENGQLWFMKGEYLYGSTSYNPEKVFDDVKDFVPLGCMSSYCYPSFALLFKNGTLKLLGANYGISGISSFAYKHVWDIKYASDANGANEDRAVSNASELLNVPMFDNSSTGNYIKIFFKARDNKIYRVGASISDSGYSAHCHYAIALTDINGLVGSDEIVAIKQLNQNVLKSYYSAGLSIFYLRSGARVLWGWGNAYNIVAAKKKVHNISYAKKLAASELSGQQMFAGAMQNYPAIIVKEIDATSFGGANFVSYNQSSQVFSMSLERA